MTHAPPQMQNRPATVVISRSRSRTADVVRRSSAANAGHDFSRISLYAAAPGNVLDKSVDNVPENSDNAYVQDKDPPAAPGPGPKDAGPPDAGPAKKAGVDSFVVKWTPSPFSGPKNPKLRIDYAATFTKDATHDPALAEFRQNAFHKMEVTAGPNKGLKDDNSPLHDDNYTRADDPGHTINDVKFESNDNPGFKDDSIDANDVVDYTFTAEQMIIDTSDANKVVAKRGPHTATIKGKDPRAFAGDTATLS